MRKTPFTPDELRQRLQALLPDLSNPSFCVALSGGLDSVTLLAALVAKKTPRRARMNVQVRAVHVHHGLHPNADRWSTHCARVARQLGVSFKTVRVQVRRPRGASLEASAREARYEALAKELAAGEVLLTAHHEDDQAETLLLQLLRGAGIAGLAAMPEVAPFARGWLVRPLLPYSRAQLQAWAASHDLEWVDDDTNADTRLDRNYLRQRILPLIRERWPGASRAVARSARHVAEAGRLLDALARADVERASIGATLSVPALRALTADRRRNAVRFWIDRSGFVLPDTARLDEITMTLLAAREDANPSVDWNDTRVQRHAGALSISKGAHASSGSVAQPDASEWDWRAQSALVLSEPKGMLSIERDARGPVDIDSLPEVLTVRTRRGGERLRPHRGGRTKTLKSLLQEARVPLAERERLPLAFAGERLVAVADRWLDASIQAAPDARQRGRFAWRAG